MPSGAALLDSLDGRQLDDEQKVNLSYWIYKHNLDNRLFDELSSQVLQHPVWFARWMNNYQGHVLKLDQAWVEGHRNWAPLAEDRMLMFLRESIATGTPIQKNANLPWI